MAKSTARYVCQSCGAVHAKWGGRCESCGAWNSIVEEVQPAAQLRTVASGRRIALVGLEGEADPPPRRELGLQELDRVLGGGLVPASAILVGGDPGIGKSTLMLQAAASLARAGGRAIYISGEESVDQLRMRARRLGLQDAPVELAAATGVQDIAATVVAAGREQPGGPVALLVIDSIQTMAHEALDSAPGTVAQVRASALELIRLAKAEGFALVLVGHVTKDGALAGPRVMEHMVDAVLYFEGERGHQFRILRAVKNRFGATDEIGVFEMTEQGLAEVANPSALFLAERRGNIAGSAVFAGLEGTRPVLMEIQALLSPNAGGSPRRSVLGWDGGRLGMLLAVLESRGGLRLAQHDVFLNVAGGLRITEPAADLAVAAAIASAAAGQPTDPSLAFFGEVGLSGEVRQVAQGRGAAEGDGEVGLHRRCDAAASRWRLPAADCGAGRTGPGGDRSCERSSRPVSGAAAGAPARKAEPALEGRE